MATQFISALIRVHLRRRNKIMPRFHKTRFAKRTQEVVENTRNAMKTNESDYQLARPFPNPFLRNEPKRPLFSTPLPTLAASFPQPAGCHCVGPHRPRAKRTERRTYNDERRTAFSPNPRSLLCYLPSFMRPIT